jgi:MFS family permease
LPTPRDRRARLATFAVFFVQGLTLAVLLTQIAALQNKHGLSDGELSILLLLVPLVAGVGTTLVGALGARIGTLRILRVVQPFASISVVLVGIAPNHTTLVAANVLFGLGLGGVDAGMNMQGVMVERRYGRPVLTGFHAMWSAAAVLGAAWASLAGALHLDIPAIFLIAMVPAVAISLVAVHRLYRHDEERVPAETTHTGARVPWKPIIPLCLAMAFLYVGDASITNFGTVFMEDVMDAGEAVVPLALLAYQATTFVVRVGGDFAVRRYGPAMIVRIGGVIASLGFVAIVTAPTQPLAIAGFALTGIGLSVIAPQSFSAAGRLDPAGSGVAVARVNMFNYVGLIVGSALVGGIAEASDYRIAFAAPLVLVASIVVLARGFQPRTAAVPSPTTATS